MSETFKTPAILLASALLLVLSSIGFLWCMASLEITSIEYVDYADAQRGIEVGWLPAWLPKSATRIQESHDIDTDKSFATFEFATTERFDAGCQPVVVGDLIFPRPEQMKRFPEFATRSLKRVHEDESLKFYRCVDGVTRVLAIDSTSGRAYIWYDGG